MHRSSRASPASASSRARFDPTKLAPDLAKRVPELGFEQIMLQYKTNKDVKLIEGWSYTTKTGLYGTDYLMRALITAIGLGANRPQDAVYPVSRADATGALYSGADRYTLTFPKGHLPPAQGFWSLTMYDKDYFFVANPLNRYSISARQNLKPNADGSVTLYLQKDSPGAALESNWLPAPAGAFSLMLRLYWPSEKDPSILDGSWTAPVCEEGRLNDRRRGLSHDSGERLGGTSRPQIAHDQPSDLVDKPIPVAFQRIRLVDDELMGQGFDDGHADEGRGIEVPDRDFVPALFQVGLHQQEGLPWRASILASWPMRGTCSAKMRCKAESTRWASTAARTSSRIAVARSSDATSLSASRSSSSISRLWRATSAATSASLFGKYW